MCKQRRIRPILLPLLILAAFTLAADYAAAEWYYKPPYIDYAPAGMPDFSQLQDFSQPPDGIIDPGYCGPVALANCFWWYDSKFEPNPIPPPAMNDGYPLVPPFGAAWDDHDAQNVGWLAHWLAMSLNTNVGNPGTAPGDFHSGVVSWLLNAGLLADYYLSWYQCPDIDWDFIAGQVKRSQDVILLLGFYKAINDNPDDCCRMGGHWVTVAGVDSSGWQIAISDPALDQINPEPPSHNDAANVSHDIYGIVIPAPDICFAFDNCLMLEGYPGDLISGALFGQNGEITCDNPDVPGQVFTTIEYAEIICRDSCDLQYPGDVDNSGAIDASDLTYLVAYVYDGGPPPPIPANGDVNNDCYICVDDVEYLSEFLFHGGPAPVECTCMEPVFCCDLQYPGDANNDGSINAGDLAYLISYLETGGPPPPVLANGDANGDCCIGQDDIDYLIEFIFQGGPAPVDCTCMDQPLCCDLQLVGDVNSDGLIDAADLTYLVAYLYAAGDPPPMPANADVNGDCLICVDDIDYFEAYVFHGGPPPVDCTCMDPVFCCEEQYPGDVNSDEAIDMADMVYLLNYIELGGPPPIVQANGDVNGDGCIGMDDVDLLSAFLFCGKLTPVTCTYPNPPLCCDVQNIGDLDGSGNIDAGDLTFLVEWVNLGGPPPSNPSNGDVNGDCCIDEDDIDYLSAFLFQGGPEPVECTCGNPELGPCPCCRLRGDINHDGCGPDIEDLVNLVNYMFNGGPTPPCLAETNVDGSPSDYPDIADLVYLVNYMFNGGPAPVPCP